MKRILLIDDEEEFRFRIQKFLFNTGFKVDTAANGYEALRKARSNPPDLIVLDVILPKMSGLQVARLLKFDEKFKKIPIIMMSILDQPVDRAQGKAVGVSFYLPKPFTDEELLSAVRKFTGEIVEK